MRHGPDYGCCFLLLLTFGFWIFIGVLVAHIGGLR